MARLGSTSASPLLGDTFVSIYLGSTRVPTVPDRPSVDGFVAEVTGGDTVVDTPSEPGDGGSEITGWAWYIDGVLTTPAADAGSSVTFAGDLSGADIRVAAVNAIGTGRRSEPYELLVP